MEPLRIFENFELDDLNENWVKSIWDGEFITYKEPPDEYLIFVGSEDMGLLLGECYKVITTWLAQAGNKNGHGNKESEISWHTLIMLNVNVRGLLAVLGYIMNNGQHYGADQESRESCLKATSLYLILLAVPGSNAFNVFHPNLYKKAIQSLKMSEYLMPLPKKRNKTMDIEDLNINEEFANECNITQSEKAILTKSLSKVICDFIIMIKSFWFKDYVHSLSITIRMLLEVTKLETDIHQFHIEDEMREFSVKSLPHNAYIALQKLCDNKHGPIDVTIMLITKYILPQLLLTHMQFKTMINVRNGYISFLKYLLEAHEKEAELAVTILIQHLMVKHPDRYDARQKQAVILIRLLNICKEDIIIETFKNIILLSHHNKISCRLFAQEIVGKFLSEFFSIEYNLIETSKTRLKKTLIATTLSRCTDYSSMVRGRAMTIVAEFTDFNNNVDEIMLQDIFKTSDPNKAFPTIDELKRALQKDINPLPGSHTVITMLMDRIEDERAFVRRNALQIFRNLIILFPSLINKVIHLISRRCRDPALTIRRFAVQTLSQILEQFPENSTLLNEWIEAAMPQIFDVETKVQEKVLESLQDLLLNRITHASAYKYDAANSLPWRFLDRLINMKMRKHLSKACSLWVKNGTITKAVITKIQSHIDTDNDIAAWILLAALAENMKLPNMDKYMSNYKELIQRNNFQTSLVFQVLRHSWASLDQKVLKHLHIYLYDCLCRFQIHFALTSICMDIVNVISRSLHSDNSHSVVESNMRKLMKICETEIGRILKGKKKATEAAPNYLKAVTMLGHAALMCTGKISPLTLRIVQGLLLNSESLPEAIKQVKELQASAVVFLGQQAMRDRDIAQEVVPIFGRLMRRRTDSDSATEIAVRINAAKALADICIRFTALVEPYLLDMCITMKDPNPAVREAIVIIFIQLLLEDFIKVKGPFFFHILTMLSDKNDIVRELTIFLVEERLLVKNKTLISQQFLEGIYHYNNYQFHHKHYDQKVREAERKILTFPGKQNQSKRRIIYNFMLEHLDPPGKIKLLVKLTSQILAGICNGLINVETEEGACVLRDVLYIISNDRLQPSPCKNGDDSQEQNESTPLSSNTTTINQAINIIIEGMKKHGLIVLLPVLIRLRKKLLILKSPLEINVRRLLIKTYFDYNKEQLIHLLNEYPEIEKEMDFYRKPGRERYLDDEDFDEDSNEESNAESRINSRNNSDRDLSASSDRVPKIVLRRLSTSTISRWKNPHQFTNENTLLSTSTQSSTQDSSSTFTTFGDISSPEPGPSTSTPKSSRYLDYTSECAPPRVSKVRRLSPYFSCEEIPPTCVLRWNEMQVQNDSDSD